MKTTIFLAIYLIPAILFTFKVGQIYYSGIKNLLKKYTYENKIIN